MKHLVRLPERPLVLSVRVSRSELAAINAGVARSGLPASDLVRLAVREYLERLEQAA